jgi:hypothetical protein
MFEVIKGVFINPDMVGVVKAINDDQCIIIMLGRNEIVVDSPAIEVIHLLGLSIEIKQTLDEEEPEKTPESGEGK